MTTPHESPRIAATQLGLGLTDTPEGQRVVLTMTMLLTAADAKQFAEQMAAIAGQMSATRLVAATSLIAANGGGIPHG